LTPASLFAKSRSPPATPTPRTTTGLRLPHSGDARTSTDTPPTSSSRSSPRVNPQDASDTVRHLGDGPYRCRSESCQAMGRPLMAGRSMVPMLTSFCRVTFTKPLMVVIRT
jgi:hypothetical protein